MQAFKHLESTLLPIPRANIDTDQILPARYLQKPRSNDFGAFLFRDLRQDADGTAIAAFVLNQPAYRLAKIVVALDNFGCGSSREHAVWALWDHGIRAVIAPSFGDIFYNNALKNGLLPIRLPAAVVQALIAAAAAEPGCRVAIDLDAQTLTVPDGSSHPFAIDPRSRYCLLNGIDEIDYTLMQADRIDAYERRLVAPGPP